MSKSVSYTHLDDVRTLIESQLGKYFTVSTASNGAEGLEKLAEDQPDIVVCDVMMPEMDEMCIRDRSR